MKKIVLLLSILAIITGGCKKEDQQTTDVSFAADVIDHSGLKSTEVWQCKTDVPNFAQVKINGVYYYPGLFTLEGKLYTQSIKLPRGDYSLQEFILYRDLDGIEGIAGNDIVVYGTPLTGAVFAEFVTHPLAYDFNIGSFEKKQVDIEVLCFQENLYTEFGFNWLGITETTVRQQCFFGDICFKNYEDYRASHYNLQPDGLKIDMPAIFRIDVYKNDMPLPAPYFSYTNDNTEHLYGQQNPVCVSYPDNLSITGEKFRMELWIYVKTGNIFSFVKFHTWEFTDAVKIPAGDDGIVDFVLGSCNYSSTDLQLPPYIDLPLTAGVVFSYTPNGPSYWQVLVNSVQPAGNYDLPVNLKLLGWCGDHNHYINEGQSNVSLYNSLYPSTWPSNTGITTDMVNRINYVFNHLSDYGININALTDNQGDILQNVVWTVINNYRDPAIGDLVKEQQILASCVSQGLYVPLPGGWAAVLMMKDNQPNVYQLIFVVVDP